MQNKTKTAGKTATESVGVTETQERSLSEYADAWTSHASSFNRLLWNLPKKADQEKLERVQEELRELIATAVKDLQQKRQVKESMAIAGVDENGN